MPAGYHRQLTPWHDVGDDTGMDDVVGLVEHPALDVLRGRAAGRGLVEVVAGPGWGRTSLLRQWAAAAGVEVVTARDVHRDPVVLARALRLAGGRIVREGPPGEVLS